MDLWMDVDVNLAEVPVNLMPLLDDTDFKTIEGAVAYNAAGLALRWHFVTTAGAYNVTSVTPTTSGVYDWIDQGDSGIYTIEIPVSGGASINNDTEGFGWFTGVATGILPWRGPVIGFRAASLNNELINSTPIGTGTADSGSTTTLTDSARTEADTDYWVGQLLVITSGALRGQSRIITGFNAATDTITVSPAFTQAVSTHTYEIWPFASGSLSLSAGDIRTAIGLASANVDTQLSGINTAATRLTAGLAAKLTVHAAGVLVLVVGSGSTTTTVKFSTVEGAAPSAVADFYKGAVIVFTSGALAGQRKSITSYDGTTTTATVPSMTGAPANAVVGVIV